MIKISYSGYRFPPEIIQHSIWLYLRFTLSFRDVEDLLAERGVAVSYETVRRWVNHFGPMITTDLGFRVWRTCRAAPTGSPMSCRQSKKVCRTKQALRLVAPANAFAGSERRLDQ